jgi:ribosomal protein S18 acetylase RimI-like enzyme
VLSELARRAKASWGYPAEWLDEWRPQLTLRAADMGRLRIMVAELDSRVVGFYALAARRTPWLLEHLWVDPEHQRHGWGRRLLSHALDAAREGGASAVEVEADPNAVGFYLRAGARIVGERPGVVAGQARRLPVLELPTRP